MTRVLIVDDSRMARNALEYDISQLQDIKIVQSLENARNAVAFCDMSQVDLVVMDVYTAGGESGLKAAAEIKAKHPTIKIIIVTSMPEESFIRKAREAGCESFWYKDAGELELIEVISRTIAGESIYPDATPVMEIGMAKSVEFTEAEIRTLRAMIEHSTYKEAAEALGVSPRTVKAHVSSMLSRTGYQYFAEMAVEVAQKNLIIKGF